MQMGKFPKPYKKGKKMCSLIQMLVSCVFLFALYTVSASNGMPAQIEAHAGAAGYYLSIEEARR